MCSRIRNIIGIANEPESENVESEVNILAETSNPSTPTKPARTYGDSTSEVSGGTSCSANKPIRKLPPVHTEVSKWFQTVDNRTPGKITAKELQQAFETFQGKRFSDGVCKFVVRLFDLDKNGGLDLREFEQLYFYVKQWVNAFNSYDRGRSGYLDENEFDYALKQMDINFSPDFIKFLMTRTDPSCKKISLDQFIVTCVQIQRFTDEFKARDSAYSGTISLKYEDFLEMILKCL